MDGISDRSTPSHGRRRVEHASTPQGRPGSSLRGNFNPITGEQSEERPRTRVKTSKPEFIPSLNLGHLKEAQRPGEWDRLVVKPSNSAMLVDTPPDSARSGDTTISWGTSYSARPSSRYSSRATEQQTVERPAVVTDRRYQTAAAGVVPGLDVSETPRLPDTGRSDISVRSLQYRTPRTPYAEHEDTVPKPAYDTTINSARLDSARFGSRSPLTLRYEDEDDPLQCSWGSARTPRAKEKQFEAEQSEELRQRQEMTEQVLVDQLSRYALSDPDQATRNISALTHRPGMPRGAIRNLHETKIRPNSAAQSERMLARSVRFDCRMLTENSRDAMRELTGFFFVVDNSLTIYEFKHFGKSSKTMPFITRGVYQHVLGRRRGQSYSLLDIYEGAILSFSTDAQLSLPQRNRNELNVSFKVTALDQAMKEKILLEDLEDHERAEYAKGLTLPPTKEQLDDLLLLQRIQESVRRQLRGRGVRTLMRLDRYLRSLDAAGDMRVGAAAALDALREARLQVPRQDFESMWDTLDPDGHDEVGLDDFMRALVGEMPEHRRYMVLKAFKKIDFRQRGSVSAEDVRKFFNGSKHPLVLSKQNTAGDVLKSFLDSFRVDGEKLLEISFLDFLRHYEGLSIGVDIDEDFAGVIRACWNV